MGVVVGANVGVAVGTTIAVGVTLGVAVGVCVGVAVGTTGGMGVGVAVGVWVGMGVAVDTIGGVGVGNAVTPMVRVAPTVWKGISCTLPSNSLAEVKVTGTDPSATARNVTIASTPSGMLKEAGGKGKTMRTKSTVPATLSAELPAAPVVPGGLNPGCSRLPTSI